MKSLNVGDINLFDIFPLWFLNTGFHFLSALGTLLSMTLKAQQLNAIVHVAA